MKKPTVADNDSADNNSFDVDTLRTHYEEIGKECLFLDRLIWEMPSLAIAIIAGIITVAYYYVSVLYVRIMLLGIGIVWFFAIIVATEKHMFFVWNRRERLMIIEEHYFKIPGLPNLQRMGTRGQQSVQTSHWRPLRGIQKLKAHFFLKLALWVTFSALLFLEILNIYLLVAS